MPKKGFTIVCEFIYLPSFLLNNSLNTIFSFISKDTTVLSVKFNKTNVYLTVNDKTTEFSYVVPSKLGMFELEYSVLNREDKIEASFRIAFERETIGEVILDSSSIISSSKIKGILGREVVNRNTVFSGFICNFNIFKKQLSKKLKDVLYESSGSLKNIAQKGFKQLKTSALLEQLLLSIDSNVV